MRASKGNDVMILARLVRENADAIRQVGAKAIQEA